MCFPKIKAFPPKKAFGRFITQLPVKKRDRRQLQSESQSNFLCAVWTAERSALHKYPKIIIKANPIKVKTYQFFLMYKKIKLTFRNWFGSFSIELKYSVLNKDFQLFGSVFMYFSAFRTFICFNGSYNEVFWNLYIFIFLLFSDADGSINDVTFRVNKILLAENPVLSLKKQADFMRIFIPIFPVLLHFICILPLFRQQQTPVPEAPFRHIAADKLT